MKKTLVMIMILLVLLFSSAHAEDSYYTIREIRDQAEQLLEAYGSGPSRLKQRRADLM